MVVEGNNTIIVMVVVVEVKQLKCDGGGSGTKIVNLSEGKITKLCRRRRGSGISKKLCLVLESASFARIH